jgi:BolA protein
MSVKDAMQVANHIENLLQQYFSPIYLEIQDDSAKHVGHREASESGETHFSIVIVSEQFLDLSLVKRHQEIYRILEPLMNKPIHALALKTYTPAEYVKEGIGKREL